MEFTGERPTFQEGYGHSYIRYNAILPFCLKKRVLDFGCGVGIGSFYLSKYGIDVVGYDNNSEALLEASQKFKSINFVDTLNLKNVDIVAMVEVLEHIQKENLNDILCKIAYEKKEVIATTPDGILFPYHPQKITEIVGFHVWHYTFEELKELFTKYFSFVEIMGIAFDPKIQKTTGYLIFASNL